MTQKSQTKRKAAAKSQSASSRRGDTTPTDRKRGKNKIAKAELAQQIAKDTDLSRDEAARVVSAVIKLTVRALQQERTVGLMGLGTLSITHTKERRGVRPGTTERITIPAGKKVRFKASTALKQDLNS